MDRILVPSYLGDDIDIVKDGVVRTLEKLTFKATDGKYVVGMWDTPMPAACNPLTAEQAAEWKERPMTVKVAQRGEARVVRGKKKVSAIDGYRECNNLQPFYGYVSEPPTAKAFTESDPVGPVASAIKAAGELAAVAEKCGEDPTKVWELLENCWGVNADSIKDHVIPSISHSSEKDIIKLCRKSSHSLYGFNADDPKVVVSGGAYRPETMTESVYVDWHRYYTTMRYIGSITATYYPELLPPGSEICFAPAMIESPAHISVPIAEMLDVGKTTEKSQKLIAIASRTIKYYEGAMKEYGVASMLRATHAVSDKVGTLMTNVEVIRAIHKRSDRLVARVGKDPFATKTVKAIGDVQSYSLSTTKEAPRVPIEKIKYTFQMKWRTASNLAYEAFFLSRENKDMIENMMSLLREGTDVGILSKVKLDDYKSRFMQNCPADIGRVVFQIIYSGYKNETLAQIQFVEMCRYISNDGDMMWAGSYQQTYAEAVMVSTDISRVVKLARTGYQRANSHANAERRFKFKQVPGRDIKDVLQVAILDFTWKKVDFWCKHYGSRVIDCGKVITDTSSEWRKAPKSIKEEFKALDSDRGHQLSIEALKYKPTYDVLVEHKTLSILYAFLKQAYRRTKFSVNHDLSVDADLSVGDLRLILRDTVVSYLKKRRTWGAKLAEVCEREAEIITEISKRTRKYEMVKYLDAVLSPKVSFSYLYDMYLLKLKPAKNSLNRMVKDALKGMEDKDVGEKDDEGELVGEAERYLDVDSSTKTADVSLKGTNEFSSNRYALLMDYDDDSDEVSDSDDESVSDEAVTLTSKDTNDAPKVVAEETEKLDLVAMFSNISSVLEAAEKHASEFQSNADRDMFCIKDYIEQNTSISFKRPAYIFAVKRVLVDSYSRYATKEDCDRVLAAYNAECNKKSGVHDSFLDLGAQESQYDVNF